MLKPEASLTVGLATAAMVYGVYLNALPTVMDVRENEVDSDAVASAEKTAAWTSAAVVGGVSLLAKDPTVFVIGGSMVIALSWWFKHANNVNPDFGMAVPKADNLSDQFDESSMSAAENYDYA